MNWNLEGMKVEGTYLDQFKVRGRVTMSRVKYGGGVSHHIELDTPMTIYGLERDRLILDHQDITRVRG
jgi:hypothetical protein